MDVTGLGSSLMPAVVTLWAAALGTAVVTAAGPDAVGGEERWHTLTRALTWLMPATVGGWAIPVATGTVRDWPAGALGLGVASAAACVFAVIYGDTVLLGRTARGRRYLALARDPERRAELTRQWLAVRDRHRAEKVALLEGRAAAERQVRERFGLRARQVVSPGEPGWQELDDVAESFVTSADALMRRQEQELEPFADLRL